MLRVVIGGNTEPVLGAGMAESWFCGGEAWLVQGVGPASFRKRA